MAANVSKGVCIVVLFVETLLFGWPPYLLFKGGVQSERSSRLRGVVISYLTCFAGGVFMGACLLHLLVEGREVMEEYFEKAEVNIEFPVYESITAGGFFLIGLVEQLAHKLLHKTHHNHSNYNSNNHDSHHHYQHHHQKRDAAVLNGSKRTGSGKRGSQNSKADLATGIDNIAYQMGTVQLTKKSNDGKDTDKAVAETELSTVSGNFSRVTPETKSHEKDRTNPSVYEAVTESAVTSQCGSENILADANIDETDQQIEIIQEKASEHEEEFRQIAEVMEVNPLRAFLLLGAMSFHTVFDGLAVGLQTQDSSVWEMFVAICIHKALVALCLGMQLFNVYKSRPVKAFLWVFFFSLISPIGVGIGMILTSGSFDETCESLASWILQAMATGTFLYIALFEILRQELVEKGGVLRLLAAVVGFGGMAAAKALDSD